MTTTVRIRGRRRARRRRDDRGQVSVEFLGFLPILLVIALAVIQLGLAAYAVQQAGTGARAAARTATLDEADRKTTPEAAGKAAMSGWIAADAGVQASEGGGEAVATATVKIPSVIPGVEFGPATRSATMALPAEPGGSTAP
ncbi:TadE/TadG family type IV pilus assembly protein [Streptomyces paromomycinus]|uniref:Septum formation initiator n=1 Tax=Streptomyces paromomycinus TaxID=92743 RepID=A0A401W1Z4_STREY|nr:TadE/TadG family type IV pilus assembly protein [Streptomyces paromomycinus]GCD43353.1 septum formation initiator [Streptomyces paromomycinus]